MATCEGCCHLTGVMLNFAAEAADRACIATSLLSFRCLQMLRLRVFLFFLILASSHPCRPDRTCNANVNNIGLNRLSVAG
jgi:hypothetical protein